MRPASVWMCHRAEWQREHRQQGPVGSCMTPGVSRAKKDRWAGKAVQPRHNATGRRNGWVQRQTLEAFVVHPDHRGLGTQREGAWHHLECPHGPPLAFLGHLHSSSNADPFVSFSNMFPVLASVCSLCFLKHSPPHHTGKSVILQDSVSCLPSLHCL